MFANPLGIPNAGPSQQGPAQLPSFAPQQPVQPGSAAAMPANVLDGLAQNGLSRYPSSAMGLVPSVSMQPGGVQFVSQQGGGVAVQPKKKKSFAWVFVLGGLAVVAAVAAAIAIVVKKNKKKDDDEDKGDEDKEDEDKEDAEPSPAIPPGATPRARRPVTPEEKKAAAAAQAVARDSRMRRSAIDDRVAPEGGREPNPARADASRGGAKLDDAFSPMAETELLEEYGELAPMQEPDVDRSGRPIQNPRGRGRDRPSRGRGGRGRRRDDYDDIDDDYDEDEDDYDDLWGQGRRGRRGGRSLASDMFDEEVGDVFTDRRSSGGGRNRRSGFKRMGRTRDGVDIFGGEPDDQFSTRLN